LNPSPNGVVVGGGVSVELQTEVETIVREVNEVKEEEEKLKFVCISVGIKEKVGAEDLMV
jgi:hypothetical protein